MIEELAVSGLKVIVKKPYPVYISKWYRKKHRKKRWSQRVKLFSHWGQLIPDGEVIMLKERGVVMVSEATYAHMTKMKI